MQSLVVASHTVRAHVGGPKGFLGDAGAPHPWDGGVDDPLETLFSAIYRNKFGHSSSNRTNVFKGDPAEKKSTSGVPPFNVTEVIGTDIDRSTMYDCLL